MNSDTVVFIAQTLVLPATLVVNLVVTVIIAVTAHKTSRRLTALEMLRGVDQQWQALNAVILTRPDIQRHIGPEGADLTEREITRRNIAFYVLNLALQLQRGQTAGLIDARIATELQESHAGFLINLRPEVERIASESLVYREELSGLIARVRGLPATA